MAGSTLYPWTTQPPACDQKIAAQTADCLDQSVWVSADPVWPGSPPDLKPGFTYTD